MGSRPGFLQHSEPVDHAVEQKTQEFLKLYGSLAVSEHVNKLVPVYWHTITSSTGEGTTSPAVIAQQIDVLNQHFLHAGFTFKLVETDTTAQDAWFSNLTNHETEDMRAMNKKLRKGGANALNIYTVNFWQGLLGCATMPAWFKANPVNDGVFLTYKTLPGGPMGHQNSLGKTATHEVGHWLGLYHVFEGKGCDDPNGDYVSDTPPQKDPTWGCPARKRTCPGRGQDSIRNFMDYSWDSCATKFTKGQVVRMHTQAAMYREM
ncbi:hypothetical protein OC846_003748 [Tilletia horrida]|uniref:Peptidase M43 pregnancy-associated plasma-A domain-containing protein n=1 Tax=Tilletia horrida TaxID=155126 RepID=A0AAN6GPZ2_9BASI|nr:hypothetical protein OC845_003594 [Tilletia horrida]KAK0550268.1 hypothetical protein OC846_003748 [Tilletia horrida]